MFDCFLFFVGSLVVLLADGGLGALAASIDTWMDEGLSFYSYLDFFFVKKRKQVVVQFYWVGNASVLWYTHTYIYGG